MLEFYFKDPACLRRLRCGVLAEHMDELACDLRERGYSRGAGRHALRYVSALSRFAERDSVPKGGPVDGHLVRRFRCQIPSASRPHVSAAVNLTVKLLRARGLFVSARAPIDEFGGLLDRYERYLLDVRGLAMSSIDKFLRGARRLLTWCRDHKRPLRRIRGRDILDFVMDLTEKQSKGAQHHTSSFGNELCSQVRVFLRYLQGEGIVTAELDRVVPKVPRWRLAPLPRFLPWQQVRKLIASVDTGHSVGLRDKSILLLIAGLGLRNTEVRNLKLADIFWRSGEIRLAKTKTRRERVLPLPGMVGKSLADYVLRGRPAVDSSCVFIRSCAPLGPFMSPNGIGNMVRRRLSDASINAPSRPGSHLLRHSLATKMVNSGVPIKEIADLLGHASINTTAIYAKVDRKRLAKVALPFPREAAK